MHGQDCRMILVLDTKSFGNDPALVDLSPTLRNRLPAVPIWLFLNEQKAWKMFQLKLELNGWTDRKDAVLWED